MKHTPLHALFLGALPSLANAIETVNVLVCLVQWANHANRTLISKEEIEQLWNGPGNDTLVVPGESISEYMASNSYGKYKVQAEVFDWFQVNDTEMDVAKEHNKFEDFVLPVLEAAIASGISLNPYANSEKELEGIVFVHSGYRAETGGTDCETGYMAVNRISTKSWNVEEPVETTFHNIQSTFTLKTFSVVSAYQGICGLKISGVGVWLHEWLHSRFGLEDLSDTAGQYQDSQISTGGIGAYGIMYVCLRLSYILYF
jgi:M6 family metalloprotease-like protein